MLLARENSHSMQDTAPDDNQHSAIWYYYNNLHALAAQGLNMPRTTTPPATFLAAAGVVGASKARSIPEAVRSTPFYE